MRQIEKGAARALADRGGKVRDYTITYRRLDDSRASTGHAEERLGRRNARTAAEDPNAVGYIGQYNSSVSKVTIPILNRAGIAQVSPSNSYNGLTVSGPGTTRGEPDRYYPTGRRTYARLLPNDVVQGRALAAAAREDGCASVEVFNSMTVYSRGLAQLTVSAARRLGLKVRASRSYDPQAPSYRSLARRVKARCVVQTAEIESNAVQLMKDVTAARQRTRFYGGDGVCLDPGYGDWRSARKTVAPRFRCTIANIHAPSVYGYEAMSLLLDSIQRAADSGGGSPPYQSPGLRTAQAGQVTREKVVAALFATRDRQSPIGTYSIDANGDTTLTDFGLYRISGKRLRFDRVIRAQ